MAVKPQKTVKTMTQEEKTQFYADISTWHNLTNKIAELGAQEKDLRAKLAKYYDNPTEGVNKIVLEFGKELQLTHKINRSVEESELDALRLAMQAEADKQRAENNLGNGHADYVLSLIDRVFRYKPSLSVKEWKDLSTDDRKLFGEIVTEKPGTPALAIATPKK